MWYVIGMIDGNLGNVSLGGFDLKSCESKKSVINEPLVTCTSTCMAETSREYEVKQAVRSFYPFHYYCFIQK